MHTVKRVGLTTFQVVLAFIWMATAGCLPQPETGPPAPVADTEKKPAAVESPPAEEESPPKHEEEKCPPKYIEHRVMPGQDPGKIVDIYYGTSFSVIRFEYLEKTGRIVDLVLEFNGKEADELVVGETFRLPELEALPFGKTVIFEYAEDLFVLEEYKEAANIIRELARFESMPKGDRFVKKCDRAGKSFEAGMAFFENRNYQDAATEFAKTRELNSDGKTALEYLFKSRFLLAVELFKTGDPGAQNEMASCRELEKNCEKCREFEESFKKSHYVAGFERSENGDPEEAMREWDLVRFVDPDYAEMKPVEMKQPERQSGQPVKTDSKEMEQYKVLLEKASVLFENQDYSEAIKELEACREFGKGCPACKTYEIKYKIDLYETGNRAFRMQRTGEALGKWRLLQFIDPKFMELEVIDKIGIAEELSPQP